MKEEWEEKKLGDVCCIVRKQGLHNNLPYVGMEDIESNTGNFIGSHENKTVKSTTFLFSDEHVLYGRLRPYLKKVFLPNFTGHCSTEIIPLKPSKTLDRSFLLYWFLNDKITDQINQTCTGCRMPRANLENLLDFNFDLPPLPEQHRIVSILDNAFDALTQAKVETESNILRANEIFQSELNRIFEEKGEGWEEKKLGEVCSFTRGLTYKKSDEVDFSKNIVLRANNINISSMTLDLSELKYIDDKIAIDSSKFVKKDTILICTASGSKSHLGKIAYINEDIDMAFGGFMGLLSANENVIPKFLYYNLINTTFKCFIQHISDGCNINNLKFLDIKDYNVNISNITEQHRIISLLDNLSTQVKQLSTEYSIKLSRLNELKQSLLHQAFNGDL
jgi:type I restriction enzyme S subunit